MSDPTDTGQRSPLSSSTSHASGTSALSILIPPERAPGVSMAAQDDVAAPAPSSGGETVLMAEAGPELQAESSQSEAAGWGDEPAAEQPDPANDPSAAVELAPSPGPAADSEAEYTRPADHLLDDVEDAAPNPQDQLLIDAAEETADEVSAIVDDPVHTGTPDVSDDAPDEIADLDAAAPDMPSTEDAAPPAAPLPGGAFPEATSELRAIARQTIAENEARQEKALELFDQVSRRFTAALEEAGVDAARVTFKVMEFAQASLKNNLELAQSYAAARSVPDIFGLHAAYITRQFELLNAQAEELREITAKITLRSTAALKPHAASAPKALDNR
jgi:hypothetical protein